MAKAIKGKCAEYITKGLCLGCERLAIPSFEGDDNCVYIKEREELEKRGTYEKRNQNQWQSL